MQQLRPRNIISFEMWCGASLRFLNKYLAEIATDLKIIFFLPPHQRKFQTDVLCLLGCERVKLCCTHTHKNQIPCQSSHRPKWWATCSETKRRNNNDWNNSDKGSADTSSDRNTNVNTIMPRCALCVLGKKKKKKELRATFPFIIQLNKKTQNWCVASDPLGPTSRM